VYSLEEISPRTRAQINAAQFPLKTIGREFEDLDSYYPNKEQTSVVEIAHDWMQEVIAGDVIRAKGSDTCGLGLLLIGEPGHGKTTLASVIGQTLIRLSPKEVWGPTDQVITRPVFFADYPKLLRLQKRQWSDEDETEKSLIDCIYGEAKPGDNVRLLILDDLGKEYRTASGWSENTFDALLRARYNAGLPTIVTTNTPMGEWADTYGDSMASFAHEAFVPIAIISTRGDRRRK